MTVFLRLALLVLLLGACAPSHVLIRLPDSEIVTSRQTIFAATTRALGERGFTGERSEEIHFGRFEVSIPPDREPGTIQWPRHGRDPDPARDFLTAEAQIYRDRSGFRSDLSRAIKADNGEAVVYIHGYNTSFANGLYRVAQLAHDLNLSGAEVHYSWPSMGNPLGYAYDGDSALFARDGLEALLDELAAAGAERIVIVAHSMGGLLAMETLRQMAIANNPTRSRLAGTILISPDLDVEVFRSQAQRIGQLPQPFVIFTSQRDRALQLSALLTGQRDRLGNLAEIEEVADLEVTVFEVGAFSRGAGHFTVGTSAAVIGILDQFGAISLAFGRDSGSVGLLPGTIITVRSATQIILSPVTAFSDMTQ